MFERNRSVICRRCFWCDRYLLPLELSHPGATFFPMNQELVLTQFEQLLPLAVAWAAEEQQKILSNGVPVLKHEMADALAIGVREPSRVRLLQVETIPRPYEPQLKAACDTIDFLTPATRGLTLGYGIFIRSDCWGDRLLVVHELAHVAQYERLGGILPFLRRYLYECLTVGYSAAPLEQEAIAVTARVCE
jgi:hypothetical protein